ncbi:MAG: hypothetical protein Q9227_008084 [Pyrenula ochraceoflavens]
MVSTSDQASFTFLPQGAIIQEFRVAGQNIVQNFQDAKFYKTHNAPYFGETIGRTTNRVKGAKIDNLNGRSYQLTANNGPNSLHGGPGGWGKRDFDGPKAVNRNGKEGVLFTYLSKDGEEGYPGTVEVRVWYVASNQEEDGTTKTVLETEYEVEMVGNECDETVVGVTNHSYFNITGTSTIEGTQVSLGTDQYLPIDSTGIPDGRITSYSGTEKPFILSAEEPDIDDCFVMDTDASKLPLDTRTRPLKLLAKLFHPITKLNLEVHSTEPAFQFYTGKYIDVPAVEGTPARGPRSGLCVEPSRYVNAANVPEWRNMCLLKKGQTWGAKTVYKAWKE